MGKYEKRVVAIVSILVGLASFGIGTYFSNLFESETALPCPEQVKSVVPIKQNQVNYDRPAHKSRPEIIAQFVGTWNRTRDEYNYLSKFEAKTPDSFGGEIQALYRVGEKFSELRNVMEVNQLTSTEVGVSHQQLRRHEALIYRRTLDAVYKLQKMGGTNRCLFEGGCFDTPEHIRRIDSHITGLVLELE